MNRRKGRSDPWRTASSRGRSSTRRTSAPPALTHEIFDKTTKNGPPPGFGGENVYSREVEDFLFRHPRIREAQVFGIPDAKNGERVCASVVSHEGADFTPEDVIRFCDGQIAYYKAPEHVRIVDDLPVTVTGKPQKFAMHGWMVEQGYADADPA